MTDETSELSIPSPTDLMNSTTLSCTGKTITIDCNDHDTKDAIMNWLTGVAYEGYLGE